MRPSWYPSELAAERYAYSRLATRVACMAGMEGVIPVAGDEESSADDESELDDRALSGEFAEVWGDDEIDESWIPPDRDV
jgi:hypothetical protein